MRVNKSDYADAGLKPHGHRYKDDSYGYTRWHEVIIHLNGKWITVERNKCIFDGCGRFKERPCKRKVCQSCKRVF